MWIDVRVLDARMADQLPGYATPGSAGLDLRELGSEGVPKVLQQADVQRNAQGGHGIAWQRCRGAVQHNSSFGVEGNGATGTSFPGMGVPGRYITASQGTAVMFVEVVYNFESITPLTAFEGQRITYTAAYNVRDNRDLTRLYAGGPVARCTTYSAARPTWSSSRPSTPRRPVRWMPGSSRLSPPG